MNSRCRYILCMILQLLGVAFVQTFADKIELFEVKFGENILTLTCKVLNPDLSINFYTKSNAVLGQCLTFPEIGCESFANYSEIFFDKHTNTTTLKIANLPSANGTWTCRHGVALDDPAFTVVIKNDDRPFHDHSQSENCSISNGNESFLPTASVIFITVILLSVNAHCKRKYKWTSNLEHFIENTITIIKRNVLHDKITFKEMKFTICCLLIGFQSGMVYLPETLGETKTVVCITTGTFVGILVALFLNADEKIETQSLTVKPEKEVQEIQEKKTLTGKEVNDIQGSTVQVQFGIKLKGEKVVKRFDLIHLNCTSESMPVGNVAEIHVNQESFYIRFVNKKCFSSALGGQCTPEICQCSPKGLWFSHVYQAVQSEGELEVTCSMVFLSTGPFSDSVQIKIIDLSGPTIRTDVKFPVNGGTVVQFICELGGSYKNVTFLWDCVSKETTIGGDEQNWENTSIIFRKVYLQHDNTTCTCTVDVHGYVAAAVFEINISKKPTVYSNESLSCNITSCIDISCTISTELPLYGFGMWIHSVHDIALRFLKGELKGNQSILMLTNCSYQDAGDYKCVAWTKVDNETYYTNKTVSLYVNGPPVIVSSNTLRQTKSIILTVRLCSSEKTTAIWVVDKSVVNSSRITQTLHNSTIPIEIYHKETYCDGYIANLTINSEKAGIYVLRLQNEFGETRQAFNVDGLNATGSTTFDFRSVIIGITAVGIFILTITVTVILLKGRSSNIVHIVGPHELSRIPIYHSAPSSEPVIHIYDERVHGYLEVVDHHSENGDKESDVNSTTTINNAHIYDEVD